jgi:lipoprotein YgeR
MKNAFYYSTIAIAAFVSGCSSTRTPDRIEVLHAQPLTTEYEVKKGDTINKIAIAHNMNPERLVSINRLNPPYTIAIGQKLKIDNEDTDMIVVKQIFYN